jgi:hypothetical protein
MNIIAMLIPENLDLNVPWSLDISLNENTIILERLQAFSLCTFKGILKLALFMDDSHTLPATPHDSLN